MKINYGKFKRRNLIVGDNKQMRPTQGMTKSIVFNILNDIDENDLVLDLFAGTGAMGFEAASLGAGKVYWNDTNIESVKAIQENINVLGLDNNNFKVFKSDYRVALRRLPFKPTIIFLDPPFIAENYYDEALKIIIEDDVLAENGIIIVEKKYKLDIPNLSNYIIKDNRRVGDKDILMIGLK